MIPALQPAYMDVRAIVRRLEVIQKQLVDIDKLLQSKVTRRVVVRSKTALKRGAALLKTIESFSGNPDTWDDEADLLDRDLDNFLEVLDYTDDLQTLNFTLESPVLDNLQRLEGEINQDTLDVIKAISKVRSGP